MQFEHKKKRQPPAQARDYPEPAALRQQTSLQIGNQELLEQVRSDLQRLSDKTTDSTHDSGAEEQLPWAPARAASDHTLGAAKSQQDESSYNNRSGDNDGDTIRNRDDRFPNDPRTWRDSDLDGVGDAVDHFPKNAKEWFDSDADGIGDNSDKEFTGKARQMSLDKYMGDGVYGQQVRYDMLMRPDKTINIKLRVRLSGARNAKTEASWEKKCEEMWSQGGINLDIQWVDSQEEAHKTVSVSRGSGRANSAHWYSEDDSLTVAHEVGHLLGLNDEYQDGNDSDRLIGESDSVMRVVWGKPRPYPRHIEWIKRFWDPKKSKPVIDSLKSDSKEKKEDVAVEDTDEKKQDTASVETVTAPAGYQKYLASQNSYRECFAKSLTDNQYIASHRGVWLTWVENIDESTLKMRDPTSGQELIVKAAELAVVKASAKSPDGER